MIPKISVIIPVYNTAAYLEKCLQSVMVQEFGDIEIICVDDASPSAEQEHRIIRGLMQEDSRLSLLVHEQNQGLGGARNTAIRAAKADFLFSIDSDDYVDPDILSLLWQRKSETGADIVQCGYTKVDINGQVLEVSPVTDKVIEGKDLTPFMAEAFPFFHGKLWRKSLFLDHQIFFPPHLYYQDSATTPRILHFAKRFSTLGKCPYYYVQHPESVTNRHSDKHLLDHIRVAGILKSFLQDHDIWSLYKDDFLRYISQSFGNHAAHMRKNNPDTAETHQYLRHLLMLKWMFNSCDSWLQQQDLKTLQKLIEDSADFESAKMKQASLQQFDS